MHTRSHGPPVTADTAAEAPAVEAPAVEAPAEQPIVPPNDSPEDGNNADLEPLPLLPNENNSATVPAAEDTPSSEDGPITVASMLAHINNSEVTPAAAFARGTTNNSVGYTNRRRKIIDEFLAGLWKQGSKYKTYLEKTTRNVPEFFPAREVEKLFIVLSGPEEKDRKIHVLNSMLVDWIGCATKKKVSKGTSPYHSPSTINYMLRSFFSTTKEYYAWSFTVSDFGFEGGFNGFFKALCEKRRKEDVSTQEN